MILYLMRHGLINPKEAGFEEPLSETDKRFQSSKRCSHCGYINNGLKLSDRDWE